MSLLSLIWWISKSDLFPTELILNCLFTSFLNFFLYEKILNLALFLLVVFTSLVSVKSLEIVREWNGHHNFVHNFLYALIYNISKYRYSLLLFKCFLRLIYLCFIKSNLTYLQIFASTVVVPLDYPKYSDCAGICFYVFLLYP